MLAGWLASLASYSSCSLSCSSQSVPLLAIIATCQLESFRRLLEATKTLSTNHVTKMSIPDENSALLLGAMGSSRSALEEALLVPDGASDTATAVAEGRSVWERYNVLLERRPLLTKAITAFFILGLGDLAGQAIEHLKGTAASTDEEGGGVLVVDWPRTLRFAAFGLCGAPWAHYYYHFLDWWLPPTPNPYTKTTILKVVIDQFMQAPLILALMISTLSILKGEGFEGVVADMSNNYFDSLIANCKCHRARRRRHLSSALRFIVSDFLLTRAHYAVITKPKNNRETVAAGVVRELRVRETRVACSLRQHRFLFLDGHSVHDAEPPTTTVTEFLLWSAAIPTRCTSHLTLISGF